MFYDGFSYEELADIAYREFALSDYMEKTRDKLTAKFVEEAIHRWDEGKLLGKDLPLMMNTCRGT